MDTENDNPRFFDLVNSVRAMRRLKPDPVPDALLEKVLEAGVQAPSSMNSQPWAFVVLRDSAAKQWFADHYKAAIDFALAGTDINSESNSSFAKQLRAVEYQKDHIHEFPVLLLVCGKRDWPFKVPGNERQGKAPPSYGAVYPCVQNILLACRAVGLGAALTTMHQLFEDELQERFEIPDDYGVVVTMPIGFPMGKFGSVSRTPAKELTYFDRWGQSAG